MISRVLTAVALVLWLPSIAVAQQRSTEYKGGVHKTPVTATTFAPKQGQQAKAVSVDVLSVTKGQQLPGVLHRPALQASRPATAPLLALGDGTTIYGSLAYTSAWTTATAVTGIYSFPASEHPTPTLVQAIANNTNGGGMLVGDKFYYQYFIYTTEMGFTFADLCSYDLKTGATTRLNNLWPDQTSVTSAMAYDRTTSQAYCLSYMTKYLDDDQLIQKYVPCLAKLDLTTGAIDAIAETPKMAFLAINASGEMFAASSGAGSTLYRLNKNTGDYSEIGPTGVSPSTYTQAATFDPITGKLYWAAVHLDGTSALYEVNTTTGEASKIADFADDEEYTGLYVLDPEVAAGAPAAVSNLTIGFANGSLSGTISATAPTTTSAGGGLGGDVNINLLIDGQSAYTTTVAAGKTFSYSTTLTEGIHRFEVVPTNSVGEGVRLASSKYIGIDAPVAPSNLTLTPAENGKAHLTWTAPTIGFNDGYIDASQLSYTIVRQPDNVTVATGITATSYDDEVNAKPDNYYYEVTAYCGSRKGRTATSNKGVFGSGTTLPITWTFDTEEEFNLWTVIDANNDFNDLKYGKWQYGTKLGLYKTDPYCAVYKWHNENDADDWLISPPVGVEKGKKYKVSYLVNTRGQEERLQVAAGPLNTVDAMETISSVQSLTNTSYVLKEHTFTATQTGNYYVGFHALSKVNKYYLFVDSVSVDEVPNTDAPAAVSDLTVTPGAQGALTATVSFTAPSKTTAGTTLSSLTKIDIFHGNESTPVYTIDNPAAGSTQSWTETVSTFGTYTYRVVPSNASGAGDKATATAYVGPDKANAVGNLTLKEQGGKPVITWEAPTTGQNGGYVNPDELHYRIIRTSDNRVVDTRATGTTFTDNTLDMTTQHYVAYQVSPMSAAGEGTSATSNYLVVGAPYTGEYSESFYGTYTETEPWTLDPATDANLWTTISAGTYPSCSPADSDGGLAVWQGSDGYLNAQHALISPKLSVSNLNVPTLSFAVYHYTSEYDDYLDESGEADPSNELTVEARLADGTSVNLTPTPIQVSNGNSGWYLYSINISQLKTADFFQLAFIGTVKGTYGYDIAIDAIKITNQIDYDLSAYAFAGPTKVNAGREAKYTLTVENAGAYDVDGYWVDLVCDGDVVETLEGGALAAGKFADFSFTVPTKEGDQGKTLVYSAQVVYENDHATDNNTSRSVTTVIEAPLYPEVYGLQGQLVESDSAFVFWNKPNAIHVTDDFESYPAWSISGIGGYTLVDGDGADTYGFNDINFTNQFDPKAYIVFNPDALGASILTEWAAHSGSQTLASFAAYNVANDDWLISPEVIGGDSIAFYAKTAGNMGGIYGYETFEVLYSSTTTDTDQFHSISGTVTTTDNWVRYAYELPSNAKYFAVRCNSEDHYVFYLDDLSYVEKVESSNFNITGYHLYRNGELVAELNASQTNYFDPDLADGVYGYQVAAVYAGGESAKSNIVWVTVGGPSGIDNVQTEVLPTTAEVYTLGGQLIGKHADVKSLQKGVYLVNGRKTVIR